jgi:trk system potassium uptake protein TrkH
VFVGGFAALVVLATLGLLFLPGLTTGPRPGFLDALFTATSAICTTGLAVVDTATGFTFWGQLYLLACVQVGGLGVITLTTSIIGAMGRRMSLRTELLAGAEVGGGLQHAGSLVYATIRLTLALEAVGAFLLWILFLDDYGPWGAIWPAVFHAVSAFCNAGYSTLEGGLVVHREDPGVLAVVAALVVLGGLGFLVIEELRRWWHSRGIVRRRLSTHTTAALLTTGALLALGTVLFALFEWDGVLRDLGLVDKLANAAFMSVVPRSAGFHTFSYAEIGNRAGFLTVLLMLIGGSPGSTAGGIKTTALAVLAALAVSRIRGRRHVALHGRTIPEGTIQRTTSLALLALTIFSVSILVIATTESGSLTGHGDRERFLPLLFEAASAFTTTGLTMDFTPTLSAPGKLWCILMMFVGRVGPLPFFAAIAIRGRGRVRETRAAHEDLIVG